jgi:hypothetical protein
MPTSNLANYWRQFPGHWTLTLYEGVSLAEYKYYDIVQDQNTLDAQSYIVIGNVICQHT